jgi:hypothetical protein
MAAQDLMQMIFEQLKPFVEIAEKGYLSIARDPLDIIEQLGEAPGRFRVILNWAGEKKAPNTHRDSGIVVHDFQVVVSANRGLHILKGANLFLPRASQGTKPLIQQVGEMRELMRQLRFPDGITSQILDYQGTEPVAVDGTQIDAFTQTWQLTATLPSAQI